MAYLVFTRGIAFIWHNCNWFIKINVLFFIVNLKFSLSAISTLLNSCMFILFRNFVGNCQLHLGFNHSFIYAYGIFYRISRLWKNFKIRFRIFKNSSVSLIFFNFLLKCGSKQHRKFKSLDENFRFWKNPQKYDYRFCRVPYWYYIAQIFRILYPFFHKIE